MRKRVISIGVILGMLFSLTGCSFVNLDVSGQMRAPRAAGEQSAIQTALEEYIFSGVSLPDSSAAVSSYTLKYPKMGDYRSAFILKDLDNDSVQEALAFYALQPEGVNTHIVLLKKNAGTWTCVDDIEGLATDIDRVSFGDLNGDGCPELFAGFGMYNTRDRRLMVYSLEDAHFSERYTDTYTNVLVGSLTDPSHEDFLLFRLNSTEQKSTVTLLSMQDDTIVEKGKTSLDGQIREFGAYTFSDIDEGVRGVYQDCVKDDSTWITELILWDGTQLTTPLYNPSENITFASLRESGLPCMDIDNDGEIEWPNSFRMPGYEKTPTNEMRLWLTNWKAWDYQETLIKEKLTNIINTNDEYYLIVPEEWKDQITASYDKDTRQMTVRSVENGVIGSPILKIRAVANNTSAVQGDSVSYIFLASNDKMQYEVWYDKKCSLELSMEQLKDLFVICAF